MKRDSPFGFWNIWFGPSFKQPASLQRGLCELCVGNKIIIFKCCFSLITDINAASQPDHRPPGGEFPPNALPTIHLSLPPFPIKPLTIQIGGSFFFFLTKRALVEDGGKRRAGAGWRYPRGDVLVFCGRSGAAVISEEFPDICVQSPSITDLGLLVNTGCRPVPEFCLDGRGMSRARPARGDHETPPSWVSLARS